MIQLNSIPWPLNEQEIDVFGDTERNLIAVKTGDVNNSALAIYPPSTEPDTDILFFKHDEGIVAPQNNFSVNFNAEQFNDVLGFQFSLKYDETKQSITNLAIFFILNFAN